VTSVDVPRPSPPAADPAVGAREVTTRDLVVATAALMVVAQVAFRAWALYPSWFYTDDYRLMRDAQHQQLSWEYLSRPFDSQFMPVGRLVVWVVTRTGYTDWPLAASATLVSQLAASCACVWMLTTLFGHRWGVLAPLAIYLTTALTLPATMWWAAALNQLPLQVAFFVAIACGVRYLRSGKGRWLGMTTIVVAIGLVCYVKAVLIVVVLAWLALGYFATGSPRERLLLVLRERGRAVVAIGALAITFATYYRLSVPQPFTAGRGRVGLAVDTAGTMLGTSLPSAIVGGPWRWWRTTPPIVLASPPDWAVHAGWVAIALVVAYSCLQRRNAWLGWALLLGYALVIYGLLAASRGQLFGSLAGLELRYATDLACVLTMSVGLVFMPLLGAPSAARRRTLPVMRWDPGRRLTAGATACVCIGGLLSSVSYVEYWHHDNAGRAYVKNLQGDLADLQGSVDLPSQTLPTSVMPEYTKPANASEVFLPIVATGVRFPQQTDKLMIIDDQGHVDPAVIVPAVSSEPGRVPGCGWKVTERTTIPLTAPTFDWVWWIRIGYLASRDSAVRVTAGSVSVRAHVQRGLNSLFVKVPTSFSSVTLDDLGPGVVVCVDSIDVGDPAPGMGG